MKAWNPYLGIQFSGPQFVTRLTGGPVSWIQVDVPIRMDFTYLSGIGNQLGDSQYRQKAKGGYIELDFAWDIELVRSITTSVWLNASWARFRGTCTQDIVAASSLKSPPVYESRTDAAEGEAFAEWRSLTLGIAGIITF